MNLIMYSSRLSITFFNDLNFKKARMIGDIDLLVESISLRQSKFLLKMDFKNIHMRKNL